MADGGGAGEGVEFGLVEDLGEKAGVRWKKNWRVT